MAKTVNNETKIEDLKETANEETTNNAEVIVEEDSKLKKAIKWGLGVLACLATGTVGFFLGRGTSHDDDDDTDGDQDKNTENE